MMHTNSKLLQYVITCLLLSLFAQDVVAQTASGRVRIYDAFGNQQRGEIDTIGAARIIGTENGFIVVDDNDTRLRVYNTFAEQQNSAIRTNGPAKVILNGNLFAVVDNDSFQIYTIFGNPQGARVRTTDRADVATVTNFFIIIENRQVRVVNAFGIQAGRSITTNEQARVGAGSSRFAVIDNGRVRIYNLAASIMGAPILTVGEGAAIATRNDVFVVTDDTRVRFFNVLGNQLGDTVLTTQRAEIALSTDRVVVVDTRVRIYRERVGTLVAAITASGQPRVVTNSFRNVVIDDNDQRVRIYDSEGNLTRTATRTSSRADVFVTAMGGLVVIENDRARVLDPFGVPANDNIRTNGRADVVSASDKIFLVDDNRVQIFDRFGVARGRTFSTTGRAEVIANLVSMGIQDDDNRVRIYNHARSTDGGSVSTRGDVSMTTSRDRIAILDGQDEAIAGLVAQSDSPTALGAATTLLASISAGTGVSFNWDFGDGTTGTGATVTHVYAAAGGYIATVTASNSVSSAAASTAVAVTSSTPRDDARFIAQVAPTSMRPGETTTVSITMENAGTSTWLASEDYMLGSENPQDNTLWTGSARVLLTPFDAIEPGERKIFTFDITAPTVPGRYNFQWRMLREANDDRERSQRRFGSFSTNVVIVVAAPVFPPWENDAFDSLRRGSLHGQNGWRRAARNRASAVVRPDTSGNLLLVNPSRGATIVMGKNVADQANGRHVFSFRVQVNGATTPSIAKIEIQTPRNLGWDKKFQIYFGNSMRLNYGRDGRAVVFLAPTEIGRWYTVECVIDLDTGIVDVRLDGIPVATGIPMHPGPISSIALSGWDRPGSVQLDDLLGTRID